MSPPQQPQRTPPVSPDVRYYVRQHSAKSKTRFVHHCSLTSSLTCSLFFSLWLLLMYSSSCLHIISLHLCFGLVIFPCPLTSIFSLLHLPLSCYLSVSTHFHLLITTSSCILLSFRVHSLPSSHYYIFLCLVIFQCPLTSIFSLLHLPLSSYLSVSTHFHLLITTSSSVLLSFSVHSLPSSHYYIFLCLVIFQCPLTSIFSLLHLPLSCYLSVSTHLHLLITTSSSVLLSFSVHSLPSSHYYIFLCLVIFPCPLTSIFSLLHLPLSCYLSVSTHFHLLITTSSSVLLSFSVHSLPSSHYYIFLCLVIFPCPLTSIFSLLHLPLSCYLSVSTHFHLLITTSSCVLLSFRVHSLPSSHYFIFLCLVIFPCPLTSIFSLLYLPVSCYLSVSTHFHLLITTSSSVLLSFRVHSLPSSVSTHFHLLITTSSCVLLSFSAHSLPSSHYYIFLCLVIFPCPLTSIFSLLHLPLSCYLSVSTHFHLLITTSSSVLLSFRVHSLPSSHYFIFLCLVIFQCPLTSIFSLLHLPLSCYLSVSTHFHLLITTSSSVLLSFRVHSLPSSHYYIFLCLVIFPCPLTSIFSLLHLPLSSYLSVSTHFRLLITTSSSV